MKTILISADVKNSLTYKFTVTNSNFISILNTYQFFGGFNRFNVSLYDEPKKAKNEMFYFSIFFAAFCKCEKINTKQLKKFIWK